MNQEIKRCALQYLGDIKQAYDMIMEGMAFPTPTSPFTWIQYFPSQKGKFELNGTNTFYLHGFGCDFKNQIINVRWDFDKLGKINGLSACMFADYIRDNKMLTVEFHDWIKVESELQCAVLMGEMEKREDHFYFRQYPQQMDFMHTHA